MNYIPVNFKKSRCVPANVMPLDVGVIHLVGIGGIGMSGIAEILHNLGYQVAGSDNNENATVKRLRDMGIDVSIGQKAENIDDNVAVVVKSTAVPMSNPEIIAAREKNIPVVRRSEMLAELTHLKATIAVAGSHGKTTTTSLVGHILEAANMQPTVINGGIINSYGTNAHLGSGEWLVAEADESDGTFIRIPATIGIITNMDPEHLDYWGTYDALKTGFKFFITQLPFYGFAALCYDNEDVRNLGNIITDRRIVSYGVENKDVDVRAVNVKFDADGSIFDVKISERITGGEVVLLENIRLSAVGLHNIQNALAAIVVAIEMKLDTQIIYDAFANFSGVKRRFTNVGEVDGVTIIDDYGHHPVEIKATLKAAKNVVKARSGKVIAVVQPHRYTRLENLFVGFCDCFDAADKVIISEVYAAGEKPISGVDSAALVKALLEKNVAAQEMTDHNLLAEMVDDIAEEGDLVVCLGAGTITLWANELPNNLEALKQSKKVG